MGRGRGREKERGRERKKDEGRKKNSKTEKPLSLLFFSKSKPKTKPGGVYYIVENHGALDSEGDYPYSGIDKGRKACLRRKAEKSALDGSGARVVGFHDVPKKSEAALKAAVARHPVAVAVCCGDWIDDWHA